MSTLARSKTTTTCQIKKYSDRGPFIPKIARKTQERKIPPGHDRRKADVQGVTERRNTVRARWTRMEGKTVRT